MIHLVGHLAGQQHPGVVDGQHEVILDAGQPGFLDRYRAIVGRVEGIQEQRIYQQAHTEPGVTGDHPDIVTTLVAPQRVLEHGFTNQLAQQVVAAAEFFQ